LGVDRKPWSSGLMSTPAILSATGEVSFYRDKIPKNMESIKRTFFTPYSS
jgi:hypothetical protein